MASKNSSQLTFFENTVARPLADRLRPASLDEFAGQGHLLGKGKLLRKLIETDQISSMIFWGPPGVGKTTLAAIIATTTKSEFITFSAVTSGIKEIKGVMEQAEVNRRFGTRTIVFVDEIHRFNKAQQDAFLPFVERGSIVLIGATTENPSFEVNGALLSRCRVFVLRQLSEEGLTIIQSTHQPDQAFLYADRTLVLHEGEVLAYGTPKETITEELISKIYSVDVEVNSLYDDKVRVCVPVSEITRKEMGH